MQVFDSRVKSAAITLMLSRASFGVRVMPETKPGVAALAVGGWRCSLPGAPGAAPRLPQRAGPGCTPHHFNPLQKAGAFRKFSMPQNRQGRLDPGGP
jgi:hypothetical protein